MFENVKKIAVMSIAVSALAVGTVGLTTAPAQAACVGDNGRNQITWDTAEVKMDSCVSRDLVNAYGDVKDATGLATMIGTKWSGVGYLSAPFFGWAWRNGSAVRGCEVDHTGITYTEINGIIVSCAPQ